MTVHLTETHRTAIMELASQGRTTPAAVVEAAKSETHVLHDLFPWDDKKAGHLHRLHVAREVLRSVTVVHKTTRREIVIPLLVRDPAQAGNEQGYVTMTQLRHEPENALKALNAAVQRARTALEGVADLAEYLHLTEELDAALGQVVDFHGYLQEQIETDAPAQGPAQGPVQPSA